MYKLIRSALFAFTRDDAEKAHRLGVQALQMAGRQPFRVIISALTKPEGPGVMLWNLHFRSRVGIAGGLDKDGVAALGVQAFGAGFTEVGTVVPLPQAGNPRPRVFRLEEDAALINRYGFNSLGRFQVRQNLRQIRSKLTIPLFVNLGKNKDTPNELAHKDYRAGILAFYEDADVIVINISSPNTPGLREQQKKDVLVEQVLQPVAAEMQRNAGDRPRKPFLVKIAPDLSDEEFDSVLDVAPHYCEGLIIANTTLRLRDTLRSRHRQEQGGLSGPMLFERILEMVQYAATKTRLPIVAVGGINSGKRAVKALRAGASLVEVYTGLVYEGPFLIKRMNSAITRHYSYIDW